jgi:thiol-disulfide isomerase/thioredoxin
MVRLFAFMGFSAAAVAAASLVGEVRGAIERSDFAEADRMIAAHRQRSGVSTEVVEAISWLGRGSLAARRYDQAERYAAETRKLALDLLKTRKLDDEKRLPIALGASIEVHAQTLAARGDRSQAVEFLRTELKQWGATSMHERISKNLNLLTLEGKPAPALTADQWLGAKAPASLKGKPQLLFLWAHWCGDCKGMAPALAALQQKYAGKGLVVIGPTKLYGYTARGEDATPADEVRYIDKIRQQFYGSIAGMPVPVGASIFRTYGVSTTPTLVLVDRAGIVRLYRPGAMPEAELESKVAALVAR